jgi:hypothetical protein
MQFLFAKISRNMITEKGAGTLLHVLRTRMLQFSPEMQQTWQTYYPRPQEQLLRHTCSTCNNVPAPFAKFHVVIRKFLFSKYH